MVEKLLTYRLELLQSMVLLLTLTTIFTLNWGGDFWEHATVVQSFSQDLWTTQNPVINSPTAHTFQTPYHWFLGLITYVSGIDSLLILRLMGVVNVAFLLATFSLFIKALFPLDAPKTMTFYALVFVLFSTGIAWCWSGFLDIYTLLLTACYPSVCANALTFLTAYFWLKYQDKSSAKGLLITAFFLASTLLIHPLTALSAYIFLISTSIINVFSNRKKTPLFALKTLSFLIVLSVLIASIYPYFSIVQLMSNKDLTLHNLSINIYKLAPKTMPPILFLMAIIYFYKGHKNENKNNHKNEDIIEHESSNKSLNSTTFQILYLNIFCLFILFIYGFVSHKYSYGRGIAQACIFVQILTGFIAAKLEDKIRTPQYKVLLMSFLGVFILTNSHLLKETIEILKPKNTLSFDYNQLQFLRKFVTKNDVILSDNETNFMLPAFAGKVVYSDFLIVSLNKQLDFKKREKDVNLFFNQPISDSIRTTIIDKNAVNFILLKKENLKTEIALYCQQNTSLIHENNAWILFKNK